MPSYEETLAASTDMTRAGMISPRAKSFAAKAEAPSNGNVVKEQLVRQEAIDSTSQDWEHVWDAVRAARDACDNALKADPKADPKKTLNSCLTDLIDVITEIRDGNAGNVFDAMADDGGSSSTN